MAPRGTALVTGGALRVGRAIALEVADAGYDVIVHYLSSAAAASDTAKDIERCGVGAYLLRADLADSAECGALIRRARETAPDLSLLVNNASVFGRASLVETSDEMLDQYMSVNLRAPFILTRDFGRLCDSGQVINMIDTKALRTLTGYFAYSLTKKALVAFTEMAAKALGPGIRVNGVAPGLILPPRGSDDGYLEKLAADIPLGRAGNTGYVTSAVRFLIENEYVTGDVITVDGGEHLK